MSEANLLSAFNKFDTDNSGSISPQEIKTILGLTNNSKMNEQINEIIKQVDTDNDGEISFKEFTAMMVKFSE